VFKHNHEVKEKQNIWSYLLTLSARIHNHGNSSVSLIFLTYTISSGQQILSQGLEIKSDKFQRDIEA